MAKSVTTPGKSLDENRRSPTEANAAHNRSGVSADEAGRKPCDCGQALVESVQHPKAAVRDIAEGEWAEKALQETAEKLHVITNSAQDAIIMMDHEGSITFWNPAAEKIFGYSESEAIGKDCPSLLMPEEYQELFQEGFKQFRKTGTGAALGKTVALEAKQKDGTRFPIEISVSSIKIQGQWHAVGIVRDITERQQREQAFQREVSRYMAMIDTVPATAYLKDIDHRYIVANKAFCDTIGKTLDEIVGRTDYDIFPQEKADEDR